MWKKNYFFILCIISFVTYGNSLVPSINSRNKIGKALDFQCFTGETTKILHDKYPRLETFGVDRHEKFIDIASKKYPYLNFTPVICNNNWEEYFETKFNVIQVSDYQDFFETFFKMYDLLDEKNGILYFYYHHCDFDNMKSLLKSLYHENMSKNKFYPNVIHHDEENRFFILLK